MTIFARKSRSAIRKANHFRKPLGLETLESREVPTISNLLPTLAELQASTTDIYNSSLTLTNQQKATRQETNVGGEVDIYSFTPAWSGSYRFTGEAFRSKMDPVIAVYDADGKRIALNDDASSRTTNSLATATLSAGVTYQFAVTSYDTASVGKYSISVAGVLQDDAYENNDTTGSATSISNPSAVSISGVMADSHDYYRFSLAGAAKPGANLSVSFSNAQGDLDLRLIDSKGTVLRSSTGTGDQESIDISGLAAGKYFIDVYGYNGAYNPSYQLSLNASADAPPPVVIPGDALESNNTLATASDLGTITANKTWSDLSITKGDVDYLKFTLDSTGNATSEVLVNFQHSRGDIDAELLNSKGQRVALSQSVSDQERLSLDGLSAGTYFVRVYGYANATNPSYSFTINHTPGATPPVIPPVTPPVNPPVVNPTQGSWTVMIYMTSTNLATFGFQDVNEMEDALTRVAPGVRFTLFWDQWNQHAYATGGGTQAAWGTAGQAVLQADSNMNSVATTFNIIGERNTGDPATLRDFITWSKTNAAADNYALLMWNHGGGLSGVNFDDESGNDSISIGDLRSAITQAGVPFQVLAYDACLMGMTEQAYEARGLAAVQVASEEVIDGPGYNYKTAFQALNTNPASVTAQQLAQGIVSSFTTSYVADGVSTLSAVSSAAMDSVAASLRTFVTASAGLTAANITTIKTIVGGVTHFDFPENIDLKQFMQTVSTTASLPAAVRSAAGGVVTAINQAVLYKMNDARQTGGLAAYLPTTAAQENGDYGLFTAFETATGWGGFVNRVLGRAVSSRMTTGSGLGGAAQRGVAHIARSAAQAHQTVGATASLSLALPVATARQAETEAAATSAPASTGRGGFDAVAATESRASGLAVQAASPRRDHAIDTLFSGEIEIFGMAG